MNIKSLWLPTPPDVPRLIRTAPVTSALAVNMSDPALTSFLQDLKRTIETHKDQEDRELAIRLLMWLCVAQRPLHPHELLNISADHPRVSAWVEENLGKSKPARLTVGDDYRVEPVLNDLLSKTVILFYCDGGRVVGLSYARRTSDPNTQTAILSQLGLSLTESHHSAAMYCMDICAKGTLQLVGECQYGNTSSLLAYAWTYWDTHFSLAGSMSCSGEGSAMVSGVAVDVAALLISINHLLNEPTRVRSTGKHIETIALIQQAQMAMERPLGLLAALVDDRFIFDAVIAVRDALSNSKAAPAATPQPFSSWRADQPTEPAQDSASSRQTCARKRMRGRFINPGGRGSVAFPDQPLLTDEHKRIVQTFSEIAQGLRHVCLSLAHPTLYGVLLRGLDDKISPMHILAKTAELMDKITAYARCEERRSGNRTGADEPFQVLDCTSESYFNSSLVRHYLSDHYDSEGALSCDVCKAVRITSTGFVNKPESISNARWYAAMTVTWLKGLVAPNSDNAIANSSWHSFDPTTSSFSCLPSHIYMPPRDLLQYVGCLEGGPVNLVFEFVQNRLVQLYHWKREPNLRLLSLDPVTCYSSLADRISWSQLRSALLSSGYRAALIQAMAAIVLYHVRRFFAPWLGAFLFPNPMDDFRLAISRPEVLLQETLSSTWTDACFSFLQRCLFDIAALVIMNVVSVNNGRPPIDVLSRPTARQDALMCLAKILCWFYGFVTLEYIFCRGLNAVSLLVSVAKLVTCGQDGHLALLAAIQAYLTEVPVVVLMTRYYIYHAFVPVIKGSTSSTLHGHASVLCALTALVSGVGAALQLRWKLGFLWLELSNFSAVLVMFVIVILILGYEFVRDPVGIEDSTAWARKRAEEAQESLGHEDLMKRLEVIRRKDGKVEKKTDGSDELKGD